MSLQAKTVYLKDYTVPDYFISHVDLTFNLAEDMTQVSAQLTVQRNSASHGFNRPLVLDGEHLSLLRVCLNGVILSETDYQKTLDSLVIPNVPQEESFILGIENTIHPSANTALEGLYASNGMLCTQCEAEGFRKITYFIDRPDVMSTFTTTLIAQLSEYPVLLSNGNKVASGNFDDGRHWVRWEDPFAKPCYLFALVAGQLHCVEDRFVTLSGRQIQLQIFVEADDISKCDHAMVSLKQSMAWDEQVYGREYDLDLYMIVAVSHFNMGAMENKGLNIFNTKFVLARADTATDSDYEHIAGVIAHEYFHNWSGNRVTCRDWFQLSLKEGFTVFRDQCFSADHGSSAVKRIENVTMLRTRQFAEDAGPLAHSIRPESYIEINNFYTLTVYEKGAEVVRMLHTLLGARGFRAGCDLYFERHDGQAVTCDDFVSAMEDANQLNLSQFRLWYSQIGTPVVSCQQHYDAQQQTLYLHFQQTQGKQRGGDALLIPIKMGLLYGDGRACQVQSPDDLIFLSEEEVILPLKAHEQTFSFTGLSEQPVVSLLREFSAPVKLEQQKTLDELAFLFNYDKDTFNRWEAGQQLSIQLIMRLIGDYQSGRELVLDNILIEAFKHVLATEHKDQSYTALLLSLPSESYLAELMSVVDVVAIHQAREFVIRTLALHLQDALSRCYEQQLTAETGTVDAVAVGRRRLKNLCLSYLSRLDRYDVPRFAEQQFYHAPTMTDVIAALQIIIDSQQASKVECLTHFYQKWQNHALVIDKWFALQASSTASDTFDVLQELLAHSAFDLKNPNRVRALIGAFCQSNPLHFHAANGQGYAFLAEQIIKLNSLNPQVAARMLTPLTAWRRYDAERQAMMRAQLERIMTTPSISRDVYEVASKGLNS